MLSLPPHALAGALSELELGGLVTTRDGWLGCRHDLITEVVVRGVRAPLATYLHRRCAVVLDEEWQTLPVVSLAWDCIRHWEAAEEPSRALELADTIIDRLLSLGLPRAAADLCTQAERYCRTIEQRADWLLRSSRAQRLLYDWEAVVRSLEERRRIFTNLQRRPERYTEDEIALLEARWWRNTNARIIRSATKRVTSTRAPVLHRLQMAVLALIVADNQHRGTDAKRVMEAIDSLDPTTPREDLEKSKASLIYHTSFGSLDVALTAGRRVVDLERRGGSSASLLKALRWSSNPLRLTNDRHGALVVLREAFQLASRLGLRAEMWAASYYIQAVALDFEDLTLSLEWAPTFADLAGDAAVHALRAADYNYFMARVEFQRGNANAAEEFLDRSRSLRKSVPRVRGEQSVLALDIMLRINRGEPVPRAALGRLRTLHLRSRDSGTRDFEAASLFHALAYADRKCEAETLLDYFRRIRRTRTRFHSRLQSIIHQLAR